MTRTRNEEIIKNIKEYQQEGKFHPLTCGNDSRHKLLEPIEEDGNIILICPDCDYKQTYIPNFF